MSTFEEIRADFEISSKVKTVARYSFEEFYPLLHPGVVSCSFPSFSNPGFYSGTSLTRKRHNPKTNIEAFGPHNKMPPPAQTTTGPWAKAYCRVLGGGVFL